MIVTMFDNAYEQAVRLANNNSISVQRMATVENQIKEMEERLRKVRAVYEPKVIRLDSGEGVPVQSNIDGAKYAAFIDESVVFAAQKMRGRGDALAEMVMEKLKAVDGKCLIKCASVEFMSFIEDVYRSLHRRGY